MDMKTLKEEFLNLKNIPAVYIFTNMVNGKHYIGETINLKKRMEIYFYQQKNERDRIILRAIRKYGLEKFLFQYYYLPSFRKEDLLLLEEALIKKYNSLTPIGYNVCSTGTDCVGYRHTDETKEKMRISHSKEIHKYDPLTGKYIQTYSSIDNAAKDIKGNSPNISLAAIGIRKTAHGYIWSYDKKEKAVPVKKVGVTYVKKVNQYTLDGVFLNTFDGLREAGESVGGNHNNICNVCNGKANSAYGYYWSYS